MSKVLVIGGRGNMGSRYCAILKHLKEDAYSVDDEFVSYQLLPCFDAFIIATPTPNHYPMLKMLASLGKPVLCEKPLCEYGYEVKHINYLALQSNTDIRMVCNWEYAFNLVLTRNKDVMIMGDTKIEYDCWKTGNDGLARDCIQLIHLAGPKNITLKQESPVMECLLKTENNPIGYEVNTRHIEESYVLMLSDWLNRSIRVWNLERAFAANQDVLIYQGLVNT